MTATSLGRRVRAPSPGVQPLRAARTHRRGPRPSRSGALQRVRRLRPAGRGPAALPHRCGRDRIARVPAVLLRPARRRQPGGALLPGELSAARSRLAGRAPGIFGRAMAAGHRTPRSPSPTSRSATGATPRTSRACRSALDGRMRPVAEWLELGKTRPKACPTFGRSMRTMSCIACWSTRGSSARRAAAARCGIACASRAASTIRTPNGCSRARRPRGKRRSSARSTS